MQMLACLAEVATILATHNPDAPLSKFIFDTLLFPGGNAANLQLTPATLAGALMMIAGTLIRVVTFRYLGKFFRFEASIQRDHQLITGGPIPSSVTRVTLACLSRTLGGSCGSSGRGHGYWNPGSGGHSLGSSPCWRLRCLSYWARST